jgi:adenine-specific DNA-methyltransferase
VKKQKLELTWIGKENRPKLEPRILLEDPGEVAPREASGDGE